MRACSGRSSRGSDSGRQATSGTLRWPSPRRHLQQARRSSLRWYCSSRRVGCRSPRTRPTTHWLSSWIASRQVRRRLRQVGTRRTPLGAHNKRRRDCAVYNGGAIGAGINNQCDTTTERMGLVDALRGVVSTRTATTSTLYECRHCGTTLSADTETCPTCGGEDVARYQF